MRILLGLSIPILGGCFVLSAATPVLGTAAVSDWYEVGPVRKPGPELMKIARETVRRAGFTLVAPSADAPERVDTEWLVELSAHWRQGYRTKLEVEIVKAESGPDRTVRLRETREVNDDARKPSDAGQAQWIPATYDDKQKARLGEYAIRIHQLLKFKLLETP